MYYEFYDSDRKIYIGKFPSDRTDPMIHSIQSGELLFNHGDAIVAEDIMNLTDALIQNGLGFYDTIGYLCENLIIKRKDSSEIGCK